jgi:transcriptional regulatory protein LEU3
MRLGQRNDLLDVYFAAVKFLDNAFLLLKQERLKYAPYYIMQMVLAAGCALLKLLNSDFATNLPFDQGRQYVVRCIDAMRKCKTMQNDLHDRFAEVLAQLWHEGSSGRSLHSTSQSPVVSNPTMGNMYNAQQRPQSQVQQQQQQASRRGSAGALEEPLRLRLRSRMSMSVVFDCIQRWRESKANGAAEVLDSTVVNNPTNPDSSSNSPPPQGVMVENPAHSMPQFNPHLNTLSMPLQLPNGLANANNFEIFDPMSWYLDSHQPDWPGQGYGSATFGHDFGA